MSSLNTSSPGFVSICLLGYVTRTWHTCSRTRDDVGGTHILIDR